MRTLTAFFILAACALAAPPNFSQDIAPIFHERCVGCHRPNHVAPMSLLDYKSARPWAKAIADSVAKRRMPPWFADPKYGHWANDARLSDGEIAKVRAWVAAGAPEGNPKLLPASPKFSEGWQLGEPDMVIDIGELYRVTPNEDAYEHFTVPLPLPKGAWIRAAELRPGNRKVVHHGHVILVQENLAGMEVASTQNMPSLAQFLVREGKLSRIRMDAPSWNDACRADTPDLPFLRGSQEGALASYLPGKPPDVFPAGTAKWIPPNSKLEFVLHYANIKEANETDRSLVGLYFAKGEPEQTLRRMDLRNFFLDIAPDEPNQEVRRCYDFPEDKYLLSFTPHFHYRGKDATYELTLPDGSKEVLLSVPRYDFNWQLVYRLREPKLVPKGSRLTVTVHYDNSANNKANPDSKQRLRWGDKSEEEMMTSWIEYLDVKR
jgi:hypothetical protein